MAEILSESRIIYQVVILILLHHWYHQGGHDSPLDVEDVDGLVVLRVEFDPVLSVDRELQWVPVGAFIFEALFLTSLCLYSLIQINTEQANDNSLGHGLVEGLSSGRGTINWVSLSIHIRNLFQRALCCTEDEATSLRYVNRNLQRRLTTSNAWFQFNRWLHLRDHLWP